MQLGPCSPHFWQLHLDHLLICVCYRKLLLTVLGILTTPEMELSHYTFPDFSQQLCLWFSLDFYHFNFSFLTVNPSLLEVLGELCVSGYILWKQHPKLHTVRAALVLSPNVPILSRCSLLRKHYLLILHSLLKALSNILMPKHGHILKLAPYFHSNLLPYYKIFPSLINVISKFSKRLLPVCMTPAVYPHNLDNRSWYYRGNQWILFLHQKVKHF